MIVTKQDTIVHFTRLDEGLDGIPAILIHGDTQHFKSSVLQCLLKLHKPWSLDLARTAPGCPEIEQHHFAAIVREFNALAACILQREIGSDLAVLLRLNRRADGPRRSRTGWH